MKHFLLYVLSILSFVRFSYAECGSQETWNSILKTNVTTDGFVDYDGIRAHRGGNITDYIQQIQSIDTKSCTEEGQLAFWINAYNAHMIRLVLSRPKLNLISDDFKLFDETFQVGRLTLSLNDIEHRIIRSDAKKGGPIPGASIKNLEPRTHFALVCGAVDCPKLLNRSYRESDLEETLQSNAVQFANNTKHVRIENGRLVVSTLMKWYQDDFAVFGGVGPYLITLSNSDELDQKIKRDFPSKVTFKYDWTLNSIRNRKEN